MQIEFGKRRKLWSWDGREIEASYYEHEGYRKRFFEKAQLEQLFQQWKLTYIEEVLRRYGKPKVLWELAVKNMKIS